MPVATTLRCCEKPDRNGNSQDILREISIDVVAWDVEKLWCLSFSIATFSSN
ncbi:hypothetical protein T4E_2226 [Trichinella pseudospiralis]|uniref:Uncharacterized protein n=1 Tax=Trichinella pseudospiralis TaxID=6337 RepID=A0A0V0XI21_TRIPS|nr:hypothetical protein T4E_2226 [Trichinella pseudospiralis]